MIIIMLGAPGSGKGTVAKLLSKTLNLVHISTGDMFREEVQNHTELGMEAQKYMEKGELVPDEITIKMIQGRIQNSEGVVFDGFPRNKAQALALNEMLEVQNKKIDLALQLNIPDEDIIYRTVKRRTCSNKECGAIYNLEYRKPKVDGICDICGSPLTKRADDNEETIKNRLNVYHSRAEEILKFFEEENLLYTVNLRAKDNITEEMVKNWLEDYKTIKK
ncbi:MAG TPA: adenylate kinase [Candidatus Merdicola faecigallinarum]|uniref:Adenylate kinase n=1 Tax=Candidatus Merdicola faecigallinarum TaxID=2840862 RepID=A0A9D1S9A2_9FIRM|nr:adenylate kinase [Candidatus Merdicola faecigallinarum]